MAKLKHYLPLCYIILKFVGFTECHYDRQTKHRQNTDDTEDEVIRYKYEVVQDNQSEEMDNITEFRINRFQGFDDSNFGLYLKQKMDKYVSRIEKYPLYTVMHYYHPQKNMLGEEINITQEMIDTRTSADKLQNWCTNKTQTLLLKNGEVYCSSHKRMVSYCYLPGNSRKMPCVQERLYFSACPAKSPNCRKKKRKSVDMPCVTTMNVQRGESVNTRCVTVIFKKIDKPDELTNEEFAWLVANDEDFKKTALTRFYDIFESVLCLIFC